MQMVLHGLKENVQYRENTDIILHHNTQYENYPAHWHVAIEIIMPLNNSYGVTVNYHHYHIDPLEILVINTCELHSIIAPPHGERIIIGVSPSVLYYQKSLESILSEFSDSILITNESVYHGELSQLLLRVVAEYDNSEPYFSAAINSYLIQFFVCLGRNWHTHALQSVSSADRRKAYCEKMIAACNYINENYMQHLTLEQIAHICGISKFHFSRLFKNFSGCTFIEYLTSIRIQHAKMLLSEPSHSILEIAMQAGFNNLSNFNRNFRSLNHCSPHEFRAKYFYKADNTSSTELIPE